MTSRGQSLVRSAVFTIIVPGTMAGLIPYSLTGGWQRVGDLFGLPGAWIAGPPLLPGLRAASTCTRVPHVPKLYPVNSIRETVPAQSPVASATFVVSVTMGCGKALEEMPKYKKVFIN